MFSKQRRLNKKKSVLKIGSVQSNWSVSYQEYIINQQLSNNMQDDNNNFLIGLMTIY